jgi:hypothetical protein
MEFEIEKSRDPENRKTQIDIKLTYTDSEFIKLPMSKLDRLLYRECEGSQKASDKLLALENFVRRLEGD